MKDKITPLITKEYLQNFEKEIAEIYGTGVIKAPIHLRDGNEDQLLEVFKGVGADDFVYATWASHLHALLKGIPREDVKREILDGSSITLHFPKHNFFSSAIVGGTCPIAVGTASAIKRKGRKNRVFAFIGDMAFFTGSACESIRYSINHALPITWVVEDNKKSVGTPTQEVWKEDPKSLAAYYKGLCQEKAPGADIIYYQYQTSYPHAGTGVFLHF